MIIAPLFLASAVALHGTPPSEPARRWYVFAGGFAAKHPANGEVYHRVSPNLGGWGVDLSAGGGGWLSRTIGIEGEFVLGGTVSRPQRFSYFSHDDYVGHNRDLLVNELVRLRPAGDRGIQLVAGGGYASTTARETSIVNTDDRGTRRILADRKAAVQGLTWTAGVDGPLRVSNRVAVAPSVRVRWIKRPRADGPGWNGIGAFTLQVGGMLVFQ